MAMSIVPLTKELSGSVATLHLENLHTNLLGVPGFRLLKLRYEALPEGDGASGYVAETDGVVQGFVCGVWDPQVASRHLWRECGVQLAWWTIAEILTHPRYLGDLVDRWRLKTHSRSVHEGYELRPIVVDRSVRGTGLAKQLATTLLKDAVSRGFGYVHLFTETDNVPARRFYTKLGFIETGAELRRGRLLIRYEIGAEAEQTI
jgi:ribosomal protein S18 acetylase RimI-like enzyme